MRTRKSQTTAFTLVELLVVITIIVILMAMLAPTLDKAMEAAMRAVCAANMHTIHLASVQYVQQNRGVFVSCNAGRVQNSFLGPQMQALSTVGLAESAKSNAGGTMVNMPLKVWDCPSRGYRSQWEAQYTQMIISYQYLGGIQYWTNPWVTGNTIKSRSPVKLNKSDGGWVLVADATMKIDLAWGGGRPNVFAGMPSHKKSDGRIVPAGGNQAHVDGSVAWIDFDQMIWFHGIANDLTASDYFQRQGYWYQTDTGAYDPPDGALGKNNY